MLYSIGINTDGFGSQYHAFMSGIAYAEFMGYTYVHTSMRVVDHQADVDEMNNFIGIRETHLTKEQFYSKKMEVYSKEVFDSPTPSIYYTDKVLQKIRNYYYSTEKPKINNIDIAIHIRRGDVILTRFPERYTSNNYYKKVIEFLKNEYPNLTITIFSEGSIDQFEDLIGENVFFKLNTCIKETFHSLVKAKVLVMAKSCFSYAAAILNENEIYYQDYFFSKALDHWKILENIVIP